MDKKVSFIRKHAFLCTINFVLISGLGAIIFMSQNNLILSSVIGAVVVLVINLCIHFIVVQPIRAMVRVIDSISEGDLSARIKDCCSSELEKLVVSFNKMMDVLKIVTASRNNLNKEVLKHEETEKELQFLKEELESLVYDRTKELEERVVELERYQSATEDRELRIKELKDKLAKLEKEH